jgi:hypothetical protein
VVQLSCSHLCRLCWGRLWLFFLLPTSEKLVTTINKTTPHGQAGEHKVLFLPLARAQRVFPHRHLRRPMAVCGTGEAAAGDEAGEGRGGGGGKGLVQTFVRLRTSWGETPTPPGRGMDASTQTLDCSTVGAPSTVEEEWSSTT